MNRKRKIAIAASALAAFASIVFVTNQASASNSTPVVTPAITSQTAPSITPEVAGDLDGINDLDSVDVQSGDQSTPDVVGATDESESATDATDGDNIQFESGDQTGPETTDATETGSTK